MLENAGWATVVTLVAYAFFPAARWAYLGAPCLPLDLCHFGHVERNPGPVGSEGIFGKESFALFPDVFHAHLGHLGLRLPDVDAFSAEGNGQVGRWWDAQRDAFLQECTAGALH